MTMQMALHYHIGELYHPLFKKLTENDDDGDDDDDVKEKKDSKARLIGYKKRGTGSTTGAEKIALSLGIFFVAAVTCYAVYLGIEKPSEFVLPGMSLTDVVFDSPSKDLYNEVSLPNELQPLNYILYIHPNMDKMQFSGLVKIKVKCLVNTSRIILHSACHSINKVAIKTWNYTDIEDIVTKKSVRNDARGIIIFDLNQILGAGLEYNFYIGFYGNLSTSYKDGMYVTEIENSSKEKMLSTMFYPSFARNTFPCFDEPQFKTPFYLILQHNKNFKAISNMDASSTVKLEDDVNIETHFNCTHPISAYQLSFVVSKMKHKEAITKSGIKVRIFASAKHINHVGFALGLVANFMDYYNNLTQFNFANKKLDLVTTTALPFSSLSNYGLILTDSLLYEKNAGTLFEQEHIIVKLAQDLAYQWFGNIVSLRLWNEEYVFYGISRYMASFLFNDLYKDWKFDDIYTSTVLEKSLQSDARESARALADDVANGDDLLFCIHSNSVKSEKVIAMVAKNIGEKKFLTILQKFLKKTKYSTITLQNLADFVVTLAPSMDMVDFLQAWTKQPGFPLVTTKLADTKSQLLVLQKKFAYERQKGWTLWRFRLATKYSCSEDIQYNEIDSHNQMIGLPDSCLNQSVNFFDKNWYKSNAGDRGYYRVDYEKENWKSLLRAFKNGDKNLTQRDRGDLLSDLFEMAKYQYRSVGDAMVLTLYLDNQISLVPIQKTLNQFEYISNMVVDDANLKECMKNYTKEKMTSIFKKIQGKEIKSVEDKHLFNLVINFITDEESSLSENYIRDYDVQFLKWILSGERNAISNYLRDVIFKVGLKYGKKYELNDIKDYYTKTNSLAEKDQILKTVGYIGKHDLMLSMLPMAGKLTLLSYSCRHKSAREAAINLVVKNNQWLKISQIVMAKPGIVKEFMWQCFGKYKTNYELAKLERAFKNRDLGPLKFTYDQVKEQIVLNMNFIDAQSKELLKFFKKYYPSCITAS